MHKLKGTTVTQETMVCNGVEAELERRWHETKSEEAMRETCEVNPTLMFVTESKCCGSERVVWESM